MTKAKPERRWFRNSLRMLFVLVRFASMPMGWTAVLNAQASGAFAVETNDTCLWYAQPAKVWNDALPIGNGRLGAMVFGGIVDERIQFNEDTLWAGRPHDYVRAGAREQLP